jgi:hypothetical protein
MLMNSRCPGIINYMTTLARKNEKLMPRDPVGEAETVQWMIAALNTIEMVSVPWWYVEVSGEEDNGLADCGKAASTSSKKF